MSATTTAGPATGLLARTPAAPRSSAGRTNSWPSRSPASATNRSPGSSVRVSMETPVAANGAPTGSPPVAATISSRGPRAAQPCAGSRPSAAAVSATSSNGWMIAPIDLALLVALAGDHQHVAAASAWRRRRGSPRGGRRSRAGPARRRRISARIAAGSSERGLSSVTMATSARPAAMAPICGRLPRSRSPPAPNTTISRPRGVRAQRQQHRLQAVRRVGVVDIGLAAPRAGADALQAAGRAFDALQRRQHRLGRSPAAMQRPAATSALEAWKAPASGRRTSKCGRPCRCAGAGRPAVSSRRASVRSLAHRADRESRVWPCVTAAAAKAGEGVGVGVQHGGRAARAAGPRTAAAWRRGRPPWCRGSRGGPG